MFLNSPSGLPPDRGPLVIRSDRTFTINAEQEPDLPSPPVTNDEVRALFQPDMVSSAGL